MSRQDSKHAMTPNQLARRLGVGIHKVLGWIKAGELRAINVAADVRRRPQWSIPASAVEDFERRRTATPAAKTARAPRRKKETGVIEFF